jgi:hypothetical protein
MILILIFIISKPSAMQEGGVGPTVQAQSHYMIQAVFLFKCLY